MYCVKLKIKNQINVPFFSFNYLCATLILDKKLERRETLLAALRRMQEKK